ncbi:MAG: ParM/StbA family protein [Nitrososphaeria archaeon]
MQFIGFDPGYGLTKAVIGNKLDSVSKYVFPSFVETLANIMPPGKIVEKTNLYAQNFDETFLFRIDEKNYRIGRGISKTVNDIVFENVRDPDVIRLLLLSLIGFHQFKAEYEGAKDNEYAVGITVVPTTRKIIQEHFSIFETNGKRLKGKHEVELYFDEETHFIVEFEISRVALIEQAYAAYKDFLFAKDDLTHFNEEENKVIAVIDIGTNTMNLFAVENFTKVLADKTIANGPIYDLLQQIKRLYAKHNIMRGDLFIMNQIIENNFVFPVSENGKVVVKDFTENVNKIKDTIFYESFHKRFVDFQEEVTKKTNKIIDFIIVGGGVKAFESQFKKFEVENSYVHVSSDPVFANANGAWKELYMRNLITKI